jgi:hypothetical protein
MLTRDDLIDVIIAGLAKARPAASVPAQPAPAAVASKSFVPAPPPVPKARPSGLPKPGPKGRAFWSEYDIKKALTGGGKRLTLPSDAIVSPLASDWLTLRGIEIVRA